MMEAIVYFYVACATITGVLLALISLWCLKCQNYDGLRLSSTYSSSLTIPPSTVCPSPTHLSPESTENKPFLLDGNNTKTALLTADISTTDSQPCLTPDKSTSSCQNTPIIVCVRYDYPEKTVLFQAQNVCNMSRPPNEPVCDEEHPRKRGIADKQTKLPGIGDVSQVESQN